MIISATKKGKIFSIYLTKDWANFDSTAIRDGKIPINYEIATDFISSLFGKNHTEFIEDDKLGIGYYFRRIWECDRMKIILTLDNSIFKGFKIEILDKKLQKQNEIDKYSN